MDSGRDTPKGWVSPFGHPRINDRSHLPAAFRSVPRPSSPLGAKASTECPSLTPYSHHRPRTGPNHAPHCQVSDGSARIIPGDAVKSRPGRCAPLTHTTDHLHHVKEHAAPQATRLPLEDRGPPMRNETALEVSPPDRAAHQASTINAPRAKDIAQAMPGLATTPHRPFPCLRQTSLRRTRGNRKWRRSDSNRRPPACKAGALPLSYAPAGEDRQQLRRTDKETIADAMQRRDATHRGSLLHASGRSHFSKADMRWWAREDLNLRPHAYQACALTN